MIILLMTDSALEEVNQSERQKVTTSEGQKARIIS